MSSRLFPKISLRAFFAVMACLALSATLHGQTTTTITGQIKDLSGAVVTSGQVVFTPIPVQSATISGTARFTATPITCSIINTGAVKALDGVSNCTLMTTTATSPTQGYKACIQPQFADEGNCFNIAAIGTSIDISTVVFTPASVPFNSAFVDTFTDQTIGGNKTFTGTTTFSNLALSAISPTGNLTVTQSTAATGSANQSSPTLCVDGTYWTGAASAADSWCWQDVLGASGANPTTTYTLTHSGSSGTAAVSIPSNTTVGGTLGVTGAVTLSGGGRFGNVYWAGPGATPTIDTQVTACGSNPCTIIIDPLYTGAEATALTTSTQGTKYFSGSSKITIMDMREVASTNVNNYSVNYGGTVNGGIITRFAATGLCSSPSIVGASGSCMSAMFDTFVTGTLPTGNGTQTGATDYIATTGAITVGASTSRIVGHEAYVAADATSADAALADVRAYTASVNIDRTTGAQSITTASDYYAAAHTNISTAGATITNAYGYDGDVQTIGTSRNYTYHHRGSDLFENNTKIDAVDSGGTPRTILLFRSDDGVDIEPLSNSVGITFKDQSANGLFTITSTLITSRKLHDFANLAQFEAATISGTAGSARFGYVSAAGRLEQNNNNTGATYVGDAIMQSCGTTTTCSATNLLKPQTVIGNVALSGGTATITGISPAFTSSTSFECTSYDGTTVANANKCVGASSSSITCTGTGTDVIHYICAGN